MRPNRFFALVCAVATALTASTARAANEEPDFAAVLRPVVEEARKRGFEGDVGVNYAGSTAYLEYGLLPSPVPKEKGELDGVLWRWASVTKQVVAVLVLQEVAAGRIDLDAPLSRYLPDFASPNAGLVTVRQLLRHQSGLPNPDNVQASSIAASAYYMPYYRGSRDPVTGFCAGEPVGAPGGNWAYNNCDYHVAGALLKAVTGKAWDQLVRERISEPLKLEDLAAYPTKRWTRPGLIGKAKEPEYDLTAYGAAGGLYGSIDDLLAFDQALMDGKLLPPAQMAELWDGKPELGFMALGQWVFEAPLKGCAKPVKIVERRGAIGGVQVRNFILPDLKIAVAAFTHQGEFDFGEVWRGTGFSHDLLAATACTRTAE